MDNKKKPYKMYAGMLSASLTTLLTFSADLPLSAVIFVTCVTSGLSIYLTPNPKVQA